MKYKFTFLMVMSTILIFMSCKEESTQEKRCDDLFDQRRNLVASGEETSSTDTLILQMCQ